MICSLMKYNINNNVDDYYHELNDKSLKKQDVDVQPAVVD